MLVWADGRPSWQPLSDVSELASVLVAPAVGIATTELETAYEATAPSSLNAPQSAAPAAQGMAAGGVMTGRATSGRGVAAVAAAIRVGPVADGTPHDPLAEFTAEISAIEQVVPRSALELLILEVWNKTKFMHHCLADRQGTWYSSITELVTLCSSQSTIAHN